MTYLTYGLIIVFSGIATHLIKGYLQRKGIQDVHFEVMEDGTKSERFRYTLLGIAYLISSLLLTVLLTYLTHFLRTSSINLNDAIYYDFSWSKISLLPWFFFSIVILALPLELLQFKLFPDKVSEENQKWHLKRTYTAIIITMLLTIPTVLLLFDFYRIVTPNEIIKNGFLSLSENRYSFNEIASVNIDGNLKKTTFNLDIIINLKNGNSFDLFNSGPLPNNQEIEVLRVLKQNNFPIKILRQPSEEDFNHVASISKTPSGKIFDGAKKSQEARDIFERVNIIINS